MDSSIRTAMYRAVSLLIILPVLLLSLILSFIYSRQLELAIEDSLHVVANTQIAEMDDLCAKQKTMLEIIGGAAVSHAALRGELDDATLLYLNNMLYSRVQSTDYINSIAILDTGNRVVACSKDNYAPFAEDGISALYASMEDEPFWISDILTVQGDAASHKAVAAILRVEADGAALGHVLAEIDLSFYDEIRQRAHLWNESTFYLLDGDGDIIIAGTPEESRALFVTTDEERRDYQEKYSAIDFAAHPQGNFQYTANGKRYITYYSGTPYANWRMLLSVNLDSYLARRVSYAVTACMLLLVCTMLSLWLGRFTARRIVQPIRQVTNTLAEIEQTQDYTLRVPVARPDELGALSGEINQLLELIESESLYQARERSKLEERANRDALTRVLGRDKITQCLQEALAHCQRSRSAFAVLFVDVDDFKSVNTNYGHSVGDQALLFIASLLQQQTGGMVGRVGGDEFLVVIKAAAQLQALEDGLTRVNQLAARQFVLRGTGERLPLSVCIGALRVDCSRPEAGAFTPDQLFAWADSAMYRAKNNGKHGYVICSAADFTEEGGSAG